MGAPARGQQARPGLGWVAAGPRRLSGAADAPTLAPAHNPACPLPSRRPPRCLCSLPLLSTCRAMREYQTRVLLGILRRRGTVAAGLRDS